MISTSFGLLFYLKKRKGDSQKELPIYLRITVNGVVKEISVQRSCDPSRWDPDNGRAFARKGRLDADGSNERALALNAYLDTLQAKVHEAKHALIMGGKPVNAESLKNLLQGRENGKARPRMLMEIFQHHYDQVKALVGLEYSAGTLTKFKTVYNHTRAFLMWKYKQEDLDIQSLNYEFVSELEFWYKSVKRFDHNTTMKYIACLKKLAIRCMRNGWLQRDPFIGFSMALREVERVALTDEELQTMSSKHFPSDRLNHVRDIFLFSCFTGLAYADVWSPRYAALPSINR